MRYLSKYVNSIYLFKLFFIKLNDNRNKHTHEND